MLRDVSYHEVTGSRRACSSGWLSFRQRDGITVEVRDPNAHRPPLVELQHFGQYPVCACLKSHSNAFLIRLPAARNHGFMDLLAIQPADNIVVTPDAQVSFPLMVALDLCVEISACVISIRNCCPQVQTPQRMRNVNGPSRVVCSIRLNRFGNISRRMSRRKVVLLQFLATGNSLCHPPVHDTPS